MSSLQGFKLGLFLVAVAFAAFLVSLDGFIINVAIPTISGELGVREDIGTWAITVFTMANTLCVPLSGRLSLIYGNVRVFLAGVVVFILGSILCGMSGSFNMLLFFRVIQGAGAGLILPVSLALILVYFPPEKRGVGVGFWTFFAMVGPAMGPMVGGWLSDAHWHWMFRMNIPFGLFIFFTVLLFYQKEKEETVSHRLDWRGMTLLILFVAPMQIALNRGQINDWFRSHYIIALFILAGLSLVFFIVWETFQKDGFIQFTIFRRREFVLAASIMGVGMGMLFSSFVLESLWVQQVLGYTPAWAGLTLTPVGLFPLLIYPIMGRVVGFLDPRLWLLAAFLLFSTTFFWLSNINTEVPFWYLAVPRLLQGIGFPMMTVPCSLLAIQGVKKEQLTPVISTFSLWRLMCVGFAVPLGTTLWIHRETFYQTRITDQTFLGNPIFEHFLSLFHNSFALGNKAVQAQASTLGLADIYYLYGWIFIALCAILLFLGKSRQVAKE